MPTGPTTPLLDRIGYGGGLDNEREEEAETAPTLDALTGDELLLQYNESPVPVPTGMRE